MITDSKTSENVQENQTSHTEELLRQTINERMAEDQFITRQELYNVLDKVNQEQREPITPAELSALVKDVDYKVRLISPEDTRQALISRGNRLHKEGDSLEELKRWLYGFAEAHCEVAPTAAELDSIARVVMDGGEEKPNRFASGRVNLGDAVKLGMGEPKSLVGDVLIDGDAHQMFCGPGVGKSWLALWLINQVVEQDKSAVFFDMENGPRIVSDRLRDLGISGDGIDDYLYYLHAPSMDTKEETKRDYAELLDEIKPSLIVFDSWVGCLAACGLDENSPTQVEQWANIFVNEAKARGCTVLILDHVPHDAVRSRGATRKKDLVDVQWYLKPVEEYDRETVGYVELNKQKDREAWLPNKVGFAIGGGEDGFILKRTEGPAPAHQQGDGLTNAARAALESLQLFGSKGASYSDWRKHTVYNGKMMADSTFRHAMGKLTNGDNRRVYQENGSYHVVTAINSNQTAML